MGVGLDGTPTAGTFLTVTDGTLELGSDLQVPDTAGTPEVQVGAHGVITRIPTGAAAITGNGTIDNGGAITLPTTAVDPTLVTSHHYRVTFNTQGGPTPPDPVTVFADTFTHGDRTFPPDPTRTGVVFLGWNTAADGSGTTVDADTPLPGSSTNGTAVPVRLYARWLPVPPPPAVTGLHPTITGIAQVGHQLHADPGPVDPATADLTYTWNADGTPIPGADGPTLTLTTDQVGAVITVTITASAPGFLPDTKTSDPTDAVAPPDPDPVTPVALVTDPQVTGDRWYDAVLTASQGTWTGDPTTFTFQWLRDGATIEGATTADYRTTLDDIDHVVSVQVTAAQSPTNTATTTVTAGRIALAPMVWDSTQQLGIAGKPKPDKKLRSSIGAAALLAGTQPDATQATYLWLLDGQPIANTNHPTYQVRHRDAGHRIRLTVELSKPGYEPVALRSKAIRVRR